MEETINSQRFEFDAPANPSSFIKVIGVGGGGNNAVNHMYRKGITGVDFVVCNTDRKALVSSPVLNKLQLGKGMGAGNDPVKARKAAESKEQEIRALLEQDTKMVFITAGMGGGTGTGAAPVIARIAKDIVIKDDDLEEDGHILVVAVVTTPFLFEGKVRINQALEGVEELKKYVDSILVINNEKLRKYGNLVMSDAFAMANDVLLTAVKGIAEIITLNAYVNIDFRDVNTVMEHSGTALMGTGEGEGENRAHQAVEQASTSVLLDDNNIRGAKNVLLYFSYGPEHEITMDEMSDVTDYLCELTGSPDTNVIWGAGVDDSLGECVKITLIATGFEQSERTEPQIFKLKPEPLPTPPATPQKPDDIHIIPHPVEEEVSQTTRTTPFEQPQSLTHTTPTAPVQQQPAPEASPKRVIPLEDNEQKPAANSVNNEASDDGMRLVNRAEKAETPAPAPKPIQTEAAPVATDTMERNPQQHTATPSSPTAGTARSSVLDHETFSRAERIKMIHDLLRNDVNGPARVESMNPMSLTGEELFEAAHSSESKATAKYVDADGKLKPNSYLFTTVD